MSEKIPIDWEKTLRCAMIAAKVCKTTNNSYVRYWAKDKTREDIVNELITVGLALSHDSTRKKFEQGSTATDKECYIRLISDLSKKLQNEYESKIIVDYYPSRSKLVFYINDCIIRGVTEVQDKLILFSSDLSERDKELLSYTIKGEKLPTELLSKKYGIKKQSVYRAENRMHKRLRDFLGIRVLAEEIEFDK